ncbi:MAG: ABC transporter ATP-binding protein [Candidatus Firestonebacteria bacterium]
MDLTIEAGQVFGLLGPNGSGKTTLLALLLDVLRPSGGSFTWFEGREGSNVRRRIGGLLETPNFYPYLNAEQNLSIVATIKRVSNPQLDSLLELVQLKDRRRSPYKTYSLGMKQRLSIARCLLPHPQVILFDEPLKGLDKGSKKIFLELLGVLHQKKYSVILTTHAIEDFKTIKHRRLELSK